MIISVVITTLTSSDPFTLFQAFIHPVLARIFWSTSSGDLGGITWSPYAYCKGTFVADREHTFNNNDKELGGFIFIDFAGSGLVHVCGKNQ